ncbi:UDP-3-O-(3-hydroxymyristoyl)glucosamine N-acyltransferase [Aminiphilus sp.]|uniref:UDP-3-O-(3-hydroxymyristoyl)glucosamine N-acyltransferase n=1 Tax=Aminiphilus sp. TaxID=1872488 RepID=UPI0026179C73|nr:UDP-3-O-(3-hydroxymyristoyl)glucosamine N-acyltransferase [Aminiphilus sp.]
MQWETCSPPVRCAVYTLAELAGRVDGVLWGDGMSSVRGLCTPREPREEHLAVVWRREFLEGLPEDVPVLVPKGWLSSSGATRNGIEVKDPRRAMIALVPCFFPALHRLPGVHPTAVVHAAASVASTAFVGPCCVVASGARIGEHVVLEAQDYVGENAVIGDGTRVAPLVSICGGVRVGKNCRFHSGVVLGADGFGFIQDERGEQLKIPQVGSVEIGDDVEIGACSTVDRGTLGNTVVGSGTKMDDHVHVGHNALVGKNCILVAFTGIAGSAVLGDGAILAARSGVAEHVRVGEKAVLAANAGATKDVAAGALVSGFPARDHKKELRIQSVRGHLPELMERLRALEKEVKATSERVQALSVREDGTGASAPDSGNMEKSEGDVP